MKSYIHPRSALVLLSAQLLLNSTLLTDASPALKAPIHSAIASKNAIGKSKSAGIAFLNKRPFFISTRGQHSHDIKSLASFVTSSGGVAASLFNRNLSRRRRISSSPNYNPLINYQNHANVVRWSGIRISLSESSSTIDQQDQSAIISAPSRSQLVIQSLQGGASVLDNVDSDNLDEDYIGSITPVAADADSSTLEHDGDNQSSDEQDKSNEDEVDEDDTKILIHIYPRDDMTQFGGLNTTPNAFNETNDIRTNATLIYENAKLIGVGMSKAQFAKWVCYHLNFTHTEVSSNGGSNIIGLDQINLFNITKLTKTEKIDWENEQDYHLSTLRKFWKEERLVCEHTGLLSPNKRRPTRNKSKKRLLSGNSVNEDEYSKIEQEEEERMIKKENFRDALSSYAERMVSIVEDELSDAHHVVTLDDMHMQQPEYDVPKWNNTRGLLGWMEQEYGVENTKALMAGSLLMNSEQEQLQVLQTFLDWFRSRFPYYWDRCDACGVSCKDDPIPAVPLESNENINNDQSTTNIQTSQSEDDEDKVSFLGYVYPSVKERLGNASRTELYRCRSCDHVTRFPRYNKALWVTATQRGRCGEYSMLLYRMLRAVGYEKLRWVVDWSDHLWVEVWLGTGRWVHLDPCEASIDEPLLYQENWRKNQTFILAFYDPFNNNGRSIDEKPLTAGQILHYCDFRFEFPLVEDVTLSYTTDDLSIIDDRRGFKKDFMSETIQYVTGRLTKMLEQTSKCINK